MNIGVIGHAARGWLGDSVQSWDRFWFTPRLPHTLCLLRIITGAMLLYSHLVLATDLTSFVGDDAWINGETARALHDGSFDDAVHFGRSYLWHVSNPLLIWAHHIVTLLVTAAMMIGLLTRFTAPAAWLLQLMYLHRLTGTLFGFDQIVTYAAMYVMVSPCGSCFSVDAWLRRRYADRRRGSRRLCWLLPDATPSVTANVATRLLQLHLCTIYLFGGLAKARGESWWDGTAMWYSVGNYEYQSMDMTWIVSFPRIFTAMSHATMFWEIFYCVLVWPRQTRPVALALAFAVHGGIAAFLGMITFGLMMIAANLIFVSPELVRGLLRRSTAIDQDSRDHEPVVEPEGSALDSSALDSSALDSSALDSSAAATRLSPAERTQQEAEFAQREKRIRQANRKLKSRARRLKTREAKFRDRVERLKAREAKIKQLVERRRAAKRENEAESDASQ